MLQNVKGIVLRVVKYGETSVICSVFTEEHGLQSYIMQGVRSAKARSNKAGLFQPGTLLDLVVYNKPQQNLQRIKEVQPAYIYQTLQEDVVKNCVTLFSVEFLLRLLPEHAPMPELFALSYEHFTRLDVCTTAAVANYPLLFVIRCGRLLGYDILGSYDADTPYLNLAEGAYTAHPPVVSPFVTDEEARTMSSLLAHTENESQPTPAMTAKTRYHLLEWYIAFLGYHARHLGNIKSLEVLQAVLH